MDSWQRKRLKSGRGEQLEDKMILTVNVNSVCLLFFPCACVRVSVFVLFTGPGIVSE